MERQSRRLLLSLTSVTEVEDEYSGTFSVGQVLAGIFGVLCLAYVVVMCTCRDSKQKEKVQVKQPKQIHVHIDKNNVVPRNKAQKHSQTVENVVHDRITLTSSTIPGNVTTIGQPSSNRVLPAPPTSNIPLSENKPKKTEDDDDDDYDYAYPEQHKNNIKNNVTTPNIDGRKDSKTNSHVYDHLGFKPVMQSADYDTFTELEKADKGKQISDTRQESDDDYSEVEDMTCPEVIDVTAKKKETFDPYAKVKDKDDTASDNYTQSKEEDPYNRIWESDGMVTPSFICQMKQSGELEDPYTTVQDESAGDVGSNGKENGGIRAGTALHNATTPQLPIAPSTSKSEGAIMDDYAVVQKGKKLVKHTLEKDGNGTMDIAEENDYNVAPPEPPRLPSVFHIIENPSTSASSDKNIKKKYSKVTARESLASISAKKSQNPYDMVADLSDDAVALVEGSSRDSSEIAGAKGDREDSRPSVSDTYAEIGTFEGGLSPDITISSF